MSASLVGGARERVRSGRQASLREERGHVSYSKGPNRVWYLAVLVLVAALGVPAHTAPARSSQIVIAQSAEISNGDPRIGDIGIDYGTYFQICDPLVTFDENSRIVPALASSWRVVNPTTYEFTLRVGAKFHDGTPVTAADVKATMDRILDPAFKSPIAADYVQIVKSTEALNPTTVRFNLHVPFGAFLNRMVYIFPVSQQAVQQLGDQEFGRRPVCAGPYKFTEWVRDDHITLDAFDDYWGGRPRIDRIVIKPIPQGSTRASALRAGEVDLAVSVPPDQALAIKQDSRFKLLEKDTGRLEFFFLDASSKPFDDKRVRQAINYAVNWPVIARTIMGGYGRRVSGISTPYMFGHKDTRGYDYNPAKAKRLLVEAGYANGFEVTVESPNGRYFVDREIALAVVGFLRRIGINANLQVYEWGQYLARQRTKQFKMGLWAALSLFRDFDDRGFQFEPSRAGRFYISPAVTQLFEQGRAETDPERRKAIYGRLADLVIDEAVWLFGASIVGTYGVSQRLQWEPRAGSDILFGLNTATLK